MTKMLSKLAAGLWIGFWLSGILLGCSRTPSLGSPVAAPFQTDAALYAWPSPFDETLAVYARLQNNSTATIVLEPLVNTRVLRGGQGLLLMGTLGSEYFGRPPMPDTYTQPLVLEPAQMIRVNASASYCSHDCYMLELYYQRADDPNRTYVMYSNIFAVVDAMSGVKSECPSGIIKVAQPVDALSARFELFAGSSSWIMPYCYAYFAGENLDIHYDGGKYAFATLERLTDWGTWEVWHPAGADCRDASVAPLRITAEPEVVDVWGASGFDWAALPGGWYRWHLRYDDLFELKNGRPQVWAARSWFTDMFYIDE